MTMSPATSRGRICTFYSFKGGVGRSMALANIAVLLSQRGLKVLVVDWDLEAPGIERYFEDMVSGVVAEVRGRDGIVEIVDKMRRIGESSWKDCVIRLAVPGSDRLLDFLSAGRRDSGYVERLQHLDWESLFRDHDFGTQLEIMRDEWLAEYDHILIDSRTGITDIGGICTIYLPDVMVAMFSANHQSVDGVADVISRARRARSRLPVDRAALVCIPVPARDETRTEYQQSLEWRNIYHELFSEFYLDFLPRDVSAEDALDLLRIPNIPFWSFGERLPVLEESITDPNGIAYFYSILAQLLATDLSWHDSAPSQASPQGGAVQVIRVKEPQPTARSDPLAPTEQSNAESLRRPKRLGRSGNEISRDGRYVIALLLTLSIAAAIILTRAFRLDALETVLTLVVGGGAPASLYVAWRQTARPARSQDVAVDNPRGLADSGLEQLARIVLEQWDKEYDARTFNDPAPRYRDIKASWSAADAALTVGWETLIDLARGSGADGGVDPLRWAVSPQGLSGLDEQDLRPILERVPTGWLVVLGGSGSGKTMLMLRTIREIISHRKSGDPVPVLVPMTSWNPKKDSLRTWLEKQLPVDYPGLGARVTRENRPTLVAMLLDEQKIMPILDGLDEMPVTARVEAINQLNRAFSADARPLRLVVTCRTADYRRAVLGEPGEKGWKPNPLVAAAAIELHNLDPDKVSSYLTRRGQDKRWAAVDQQLRQHGELARALNTPLYASLASEIYNPSHQEDRSRRRDPEELCSLRSEEAVQNHLLDQFIPAVYADAQAKLDNRAAEEYEEPKQLPAERWLMILADYLAKGRKEPATSLEWWDLRGLAPTWLVPAFLGVVCGTASGVAAATGTHVGVGIGVGFGTGMLIAIAIGVCFFEARRHQDHVRLSRGRLSQLAYERRYRSRRPGPGMAGGMVGAVVGGLAAGVAGRYHIGHDPSLFSGLPGALGIAIGAGASTDFIGGFVGVLVGAFVGGCLAGVGLGLPAGLVNGLGVAVAVALAIERIGRHAPSRWRPRWEGDVGIPGGVVVGLVIGLIVWREAGTVFGIVSGVLLAAFAALPFGLRHADENLEYVPSPGQALARDVRAFRFTALSAGLAAGLAGFLSISMSSLFEVHAKASLSAIVGDGLGIGVASGLIVGLTFGVYHSASPEFRIISWWLALREKMPWRLMYFLDEAYRRGVLRHSGAVYQFRYLSLQVRLAARFETESSVRQKGRPDSANRPLRQSP
jgi:cellulose biosynthesis protein BcsQ